MLSLHFFAFALLAVSNLDASVAVLWTDASKLGTHRTRHLRRGVKLEVYHPASTYETFGADGLSHALERRAHVALAETAQAFVASRLSVNQSAVLFRSGYSADNVTYAYLRQHHEGIPFANAVANVAFGGGGKVVAFGSSFVAPTAIAASTPTLPLAQAVAIAEDALAGKYNGHPTSLQYVVEQDHSAALAHVLQVQNAATGAWFEAFVDAHDGHLVSVVDFVADATFKALPIQKEAPYDGFEIIVNPEDPLASPQGWLSTDNTTQSNFTSGNNAKAYSTALNPKGAPDTTSGVFIYNTTDDTPSLPSNVNAAVTNAFYIVNSMHDLMYRYGFTEAAYNFQSNNLGKGGEEGDPVLVSVQDASGTNNANFATPADGQSGQMRMYIWTLTEPQRDGALENDIVVHEMTHGVSNRLTGGGTGACLQTVEAGGLGEGWSDAVADWTEKTSSAVPDYLMGQYVTNDTRGIRTHPYSTNASTNPLRYSSVAALEEVHNIGEVWANMLHNVYAALVGALGFDASARTNPDGTAGNVVWLRLIVKAFALQPCNPTFVTARDAIVQADATVYGGANNCTLWTAFAGKGLGVDAKNYVDDFTVPAGC